MSDPTQEAFEIALAEAIAAERRRNLNTATVRTGVPAVWAAALIWVADWFGIKLDPNAIIVAAPGVMIVVYRGARELETRWPWIGRVFLGSNRQPVVYENVNGL
jgi:hypothetical protein